MTQLVIANSDMLRIASNVSRLPFRRIPSWNLQPLVAQKKAIDARSVVAAKSEFLDLPHQNMLREVKLKFGDHRDIGLHRV